MKVLLWIKKGKRFIHMISNVFFLQIRPPHPHVSWKTVRRSGYLMSWPAPLNRSFAKHMKMSREQNTRWEWGSTPTSNKRHAVLLYDLKGRFHLLFSFPQGVPLQTPSEIKVENEGPLQVDSSSPGSPESSSSMSDDSKDSRVRTKVQHIVPNWALSCSERF